MVTRIHIGHPDWDGPVLSCPGCGWAYTHVELVYVAARTEDGEPINLSVNATTGHIATRGTFTPVGQTVGIGRRHRIALAGACENGCEFALVFTQHKGVTFVEWDQSHRSDHLEG